MAMTKTVLDKKFKEFKRLYINGYGKTNSVKEWALSFRVSQDRIRNWLKKMEAANEQVSKRKLSNEN